MNLAAWILGFFWIGFLLFGIISWAINRTFGQLNDLEVEFDEIDKDNVI